MWNINLSSQSKYKGNKGDQMNAALIWKWSRSSHMSGKNCQPTGSHFLKLIVGLILFSCLNSTVFAQLNGHNLRGDFGLQAASQPPPGWYGSLMYFNYTFDTLRTRDGNAIPTAGGEITADGVAAILWWVSEKQFFGGNYGAMIAPAVVNNRLEAPIFGVDDNTGYGFGDLYVQPAMLGWHTDHFDYTTGLGLFIPTGKYEAGGDDNVGLGMWSFEFLGGATAYFDKARSWHLSALAAYEIHTDKEDTDVRVGDIFTIEGGLGKSFMEGAVNVGLAYMGQWKVTDDDFGGIPPPGFPVGRHRIFSAGPELTVPLFATEKTAGLLTARYLWDFESRSTSEGQTFILAFTMMTL